MTPPDGSGDPLVSSAALIERLRVEASVCTDAAASMRSSMEGCASLGMWAEHNRWRRLVEDETTKARRATDAADTIAALTAECLRLRDENQQLNHWHRRAQKAEAELCVTAEERARQGQSIGRRLAGATWQHYKDRAEAAEAEQTRLRSALLDEETEHAIRKYLWLSHGHQGVYGDDGEMQCSECIAFGAVDYKRQPLKVLIEAVQRVKTDALIRALTPPTPSGA